MNKSIIKKNNIITTIEFTSIKDLLNLEFEYIYFNTSISDEIMKKLTYHDYYYFNGNDNKAIYEYKTSEIIFSKFVIDNFIDCMNNNLQTYGYCLSNESNQFTITNDFNHIIYDFKIHSNLMVNYIDKKNLIMNDKFIDIKFTSEIITSYEQLYRYVILGYIIKNEYIKIENIENIENIVPFNISDEIIVKYNKFFTNYKFMENIQITKHMDLNILYDKMDNIHLLTENNNGYTLYYYSKDMWQKPIITEKIIFDTFKKNNNIPDNYLAFPWATLIDDINTNGTSELLFITKFKCPNTSLITTCQHIYYRNLLPLFKQIGITILFVPHLEKSDYLMQEKFGIILYPISLYPYNKCNTEFKNISDRKYLFSFTGAHDKNVYMSTIRNKLLNIPQNDNYNIHIKINNEWFYNKNIYCNEQFNDSENDKYIEFQKLLLDSKYSLCPSGTGCNSIRFFESLSYGSIPILLSDEIILPKFIDWSNYILQIEEHNINNIYKIIEQNDKIDCMSKKCVEIFLEYFDNDKFDKQIIWHIQNKPEYFTETKANYWLSYYNYNINIPRFNWSIRKFDENCIIKNQINDTIILKKRYDLIFDHLFYIKTLKENNVIMFIDDINKWLIMVNILIHKKIFENRKKLIIYTYGEITKILKLFNTYIYIFLDDFQMINNFLYINSINDIN